MAVGYVLFLKVEIVGGDCRSIWVCWKFREKSGRSDKTFYCSVVQHSQLITIQLKDLSLIGAQPAELGNLAQLSKFWWECIQGQSLGLCSFKKDGIKNIESFVKLSTDKNFLIQVKAIKLDTPTEPRYRFNIVAIHDPPQENP